MKTAISVPDSLFRAAEKISKRLGFSRSKLYSHALERYIQQLDDDAITSRLDEVHASERSSLDPKLRAIQARSLPKASWK